MAGSLVELMDVAALVNCRFMLCFPFSAGPAAVVVYLSGMGPRLFLAAARLPTIERRDDIRALCFATAQQLRDPQRFRAPAGHHIAIETAGPAALSIAFMRPRNDRRARRRFVRIYGEDRVIKPQRPRFDSNHDGRMDKTNVRGQLFARRDSLRAARLLRPARF